MAERELRALAQEHTDTVAFRNAPRDERIGQPRTRGQELAKGPVADAAVGILDDHRQCVRRVALADRAADVETLGPGPAEAPHGVIVGKTAGDHAWGDLMSAIYALDDTRRQQFLRCRHPDRIARRVEYALGEAGSDAGAHRQEPLHVAIGFEHVVGAHAWEAGAMEAKLGAGRKAAVDAAQEGNGAGRGAAGVDACGEPAAPDHAADLEARSEERRV